LREHRAGSSQRERADEETNRHSRISETR
jgi:hypothetical protein